MNIYEKLKELNLELPAAPPKGGVYSPCQEFGKSLVYISGCGPVIGTKRVSGKLGSEYTIEEGQEAARRCMINIISNLHHELGDLNRIKQFVKLLGFVASAPDFYEHPQVINGASQLLKDVFGDEIGLPARSAIGVAALPWNIPVEIELILELKES